MKDNFSNSIGRGGSAGITDSSIDRGGGGRKPPAGDHGAKGVRATSGAPNPHRVAPVSTGSQQQSKLSRE